MKNKSLVTDYLERSQSRLRALEVLYKDENWADVMRESQQIVELVLKAVLRSSKIDPPRLHDVSEIMEDNLSSLPELFKKNIKSVSKISRTLRKDRELAFYGSDDITPSEFYKKEDAKEAKEWAIYIVKLALDSKIK